MQCSQSLEAFYLSHPGCFSAVSTMVFVCSLAHSPAFAKNQMSNVGTSSSVRAHFA